MRVTRRLFLSTLAGVLAILPCAGFGAGSSWIDLPSMPSAQCEAATVVVNDKLYLLGGWSDQTSPFALVQIYDGKSKSWSQGTPLPEPVHHAGVAAVDGKIYLVGGFIGPFPQREPVDHVWRFDPATRVWTALAPLPSPRGALIVGAIDGRLYAAGGEHHRPEGAAVPPGAPAAYEPVADLAVYDPAKNEWQALPPMRVRRDHAYGAVIEGRLYVAGGRDRPKYDIAAVEEFDPTTGAWRARAPMPTGRSGGSGAVLDDRFFTFGGEGNKESPIGIYDQVESYDPEKDAWTGFSPMKHPRHSTSAAAVEDRILIAGGVPRAGGDGAVAIMDAMRPD